jgi:hypothetical protein
MCAVGVANCCRQGVQQIHACLLAYVSNSAALAARLWRTRRAHYATPTTNRTSVLGCAACWTSRRAARTQPTLHFAVAVVHATSATWDAGGLPSASLQPAPLQPLPGGQVCWCHQLAATVFSLRASSYNCGGTDGACNGDACLSHAAMRVALQRGDPSRPAELAWSSSFCMKRPEHTRSEFTFNKALKLSAKKKLSSSRVAVYTCRPVERVEV